MQNSRLQHIDVWRFIAISMVLVCHLLAHSHTWYQQTIPGLVWRLTPNGTVGVQLFFCISGFVICRGLLRETQVSGSFSMRGFFIRRAYRILPPLAVFIVAVAALTVLGLFEVDAGQFVRAALFLCNMEPLGDCGWALGHTWSLAYEEQFYLLFPMAAVTLGLIRKPQRLLWILIGFSAVFLLNTAAGGPVFLSTYLNYFTYMLAGCVCALYWDRLQPILKRIPFAAWLVVTLAVAGLNWIILPEAFKTFVYPVVLPILMCIAVFGTPIHRPVVQAVFLNPVLAHLGRISYGIYLWQQLATYDYGASSPILALALVIAAVALAHYSYQHVELPLMKRGAELSAMRPAVIAPAIAEATQEEMEEDLLRRGV